jgi:cell division protein FtsI/penicillin-binding protein 2
MPFYYDMIAEIISDNSDLQKNDIIRRLNSATGGTVVISENIDENQLSNIRAAFVARNLHVLVSAFRRVRRIHIKDNLADRLIGGTSELADNATRFNRYTFRLIGTNGIERAFNNHLQGEYGWREVMFDARQRIVPIPNVAEKPVVNGSSIYLTIDANIQEILENNLRIGLERYRSRAAIGVIMNPNNGNIVAMAGLNRSDRNTNDNKLRTLENYPIQYLFEPGSTMKPFVSLHALEKKLVRENDVIDCRPMTIGTQRNSRTIRDTENLGNISFRDVIVLSSNVGVAKIAEKIGKRGLYNNYISFGFGNTTRVDLENENSGVFRKVNDWSDFSLHSLSFGQEMSVTALQLANAYCTLANGGFLLKPNIIAKKVDESGKTYFQSQRTVIRKISNKNAIDLNNSFLLDAVERGTGRNTRFQNIKIAGKTGTSEKMSNGRTLYTATFAGFFPYENPQYVMVIVYDEPEHRFRFGSQSAAVTFRNVVREMLTLPDCNVIPSIRMHSQTIVTMPKLTNMKVEEAKQILQKNNISFHIYNEKKDSFIVHQLPQAGTKFGSNNKVSLYASTERYPRQRIYQVDVMPDLVGMSLRQAIQVSKDLSLNIRIEGSGVVVSQTIKPGEKIRIQQNCLLVAR